jgi:Coenzyme PQQ synthesis protein D (PqqD)
LPVRGRLSHGKLVIAHDRQGYELSAVAAAIWKLSNGRQSLDEIVDTIAVEFEIDRATVEADAIAFIDELVEIDFMEWRPSRAELAAPS